MRTIAIGDIHGCSLALAVLIEQIRPTSDDRLVFLGDYVDRGANSRNVIEQVIELSRHCHVIPLRGNHESLFLNVLESGQPNPMWLSACGGSETLVSYGGDLSQVPPAHREFLKSCLPYFETERHVFVHANYDPDKPFAEQNEHLLLWTHLTHFIPNPHCSKKTVIVGHTPQRNGEILNLGHVVCIDTACFANGWLTALNVDTGQFWQVDKFGEVRGR